MNCDKCRQQCKAACCGPVPFDPTFVKENPPAKAYKEQIQFLGGTVVLLTENGMCPYLDDEYRCSIYEQRPDVCKDFGIKTDDRLQCPYQDKDGRMRSRPERRDIERKQNKLFKRIARR